MRPKKVVLVIDERDDSLSATIFSLLVRGYKAVGARTLKEAGDIITSVQIDITFIQNRNQEAVDMSVDFGIPFVVKGNLSMGEAMAILKIRSTRRGPRPSKRKGPQKSSPFVEVKPLSASVAHARH